MSFITYFIPECKNIAIALRIKADYNPVDSDYACSTQTDS